jgi:amino acid transporter
MTAEEQSGQAPVSAPAPGADEQPTLTRDEIGLRGSIIFALAGAAPGQTIAIVLALLVATAAYGTLMPVLITTAGLLCIALSFHRLNMWRQNAGATFEWVSRAFNPYAGFLVGWLMLIAFGGFVLIDVITIGPSVLALIGVSPGNQWAGAAAIVIIATLLTATAVVGLRPSARLQFTVAAIEYTILTVFIVWAFIAVYIVHKPGTVSPNIHWLSFSGTGAGSFSAAMIIAVASIAGWDGGIYVNEETQRPEKNPGLGAVIGVAILGVLFFAMFATYQGIAPLPALQAHADNAAAFVGQTLGGTAGEKFMALAVTLSVLATTQVAIIGTARLIFSMSRDRVLPPQLGRVSERFRTPAITTALLGGLMIVLGIIDIFQSSVANAISDLISVSGFLYAMFYAITALAAAWYYRRQVIKSFPDALILGFLPLAGAALLLWVGWKAAQALTGAERGILIGIGILGIILMIIAAAVYKSPTFKTKAETATTTEATNNLGSHLAETGS